MYSKKVYKSKRFNRDSILDAETYYKKIETFEYLNIYSYQWNAAVIHQAQRKDS